MNDFEEVTNNIIGSAIKWILKFIIDLELINTILLFVLWILTIFVIAIKLI